MAKSTNFRLLKNTSGQSVVEYILLMAVISSLGYTFYNNKRFKAFMKGNDGMFATMKKGMSYSYRYGIEYKSDISIDEKMSFDYQSNKHDSYVNPQTGTSRFFAGAEPYPKR